MRRLRWRRGVWTPAGGDGAAARWGPLILAGPPGAEGAPGAVGAGTAQGNALPAKPTAVPQPGALASATPLNSGGLSGSSSPAAHRRCASAPGTSSACRLRLAARRLHRQALLRTFAPSAACHAAPSMSWEPKVFQSWVSSRYSSVMSASWWREPPAAARSCASDRIDGFAVSPPPGLLD